MDAEAVLERARRHHRDRLNDALRRPGLFGRDETAEVLLLEAMAAVDDKLDRWEAEYAALRASPAFTSTGVHGAYREILPANARRYAVASVYAEIAHRCGWLDLDRILLEPDHRRLAADIGEWVAQDRTLAEVTGAFGPPSLPIGSTNPNYPKTLVYASDESLICVHLWNRFADGGGGEHPEPVVLAVRHKPGPFPEAFSFTPEGQRRRADG
ncbi:hypothetical protein [Actinoplanes sp. NPDC026619]|uniref:hypothetical protein n=1 Tax=Actinoplanes sp. NPDC026619 TaxID=3155798 RepID=UPI0033E3A720